MPGRGAMKWVVVAAAVLGATHALSDPPGSFQPTTIARFNTPRGRAGEAIAPAGDVNGDGIEDLLVLLPTLPAPMGIASAVYVLPGLGDGGFGPQVQSLTAAPGAALLGRCDVDGDGTPDIVTASSERFTIRWGNGGILSTPISPQGSADVSLACRPGPGAQAVLLGASEAPNPINSNQLNAGTVRAFTHLSNSQPPLVSTVLDNGMAFDRCGAGLGAMMTSAGPVVAVGCPGNGSNLRGQLRLVLGATARVFPASPQDTFNFGARLDAIGDFDGDGEPDWAVGLARIVATADAEAVVQVRSLDGGLLYTEAFSDSDQAPRSLARVGDVNGDGYADFAVGLVDIRAQQVTNVRVVFGRDSREDAGPPSLELDGDPSFGTSLAGLGDRNGDGFGDLAIGVPADNDQRGKVVMVMGGARGPPSTPAQQFAVPVRSIARAGDVDGDGRDDVIFATPTQVQLLLTSQQPAMPNVLLPLSTAQSAVVAGAGDVNGDGYADVLVGTPQEAGGGAVRVFLGPQGRMTTGVPWVLRGALDERFGESIAGVGDINGDGYDDVAVGVPGRDAARGSLLVYYGRATGLDPHSSRDGSMGADEFGAAVSGVGDFNGDGFPDVAVVSAGSKHVAILGVVDGGLATLWTSAPQEPFASIVGGGHDLNGDGFDDVVLVPSSSNGQFTVVLGAAAEPSVTTLPIKAFTAAVLSSVVSVGDVNGDGLGDVVVVGTQGHAALYFGDTASTLVPAAKWSPPNVSGGYQLAAGVGDVNGDTFSDFVVTAPMISQVHFFPGGDLARGRPFGLTQFFGMTERGAGYRALVGEQITLGALLRDELGLGLPLSLELEVLPVGKRFTGVPTHTQPGATASGPGRVTISGLPPGRYHWRARVASGGRVGRWRSFGGNGESATDFSVGLMDGMPDAGVSPGDAGTVGPPDSGLAQSDAGVSPGDTKPKEFGTVGCGCDAGAVSPLLLAALALAVARARRRRA